MPFTIDFPAEHVSVGVKRSVSVCMSQDRRGVMSTRHVKYEKSGRDNDMRNWYKRVPLLQLKKFRKMLRKLHCKYNLKCSWTKILAYLFLELWRRKVNKCFFQSILYSSGSWKGGQNHSKIKWMQEVWGKVFREVTNTCFIVGKSEQECWVNRKDSLLKTDGFSNWLDVKNRARIYT